MVRIVVLAFALAAGSAAAQPAPAGVLVVESDPARGSVQIDSMRVGPSPARVSVAAGLRRVRVYYNGYEPFDESVLVRSGETVRVAPVLVRRTGTLSVEGLPPGAAVHIDGAPAEGPTAVPTGEARVRVDVPGRRPAEVLVRVDARVLTQVSYRPRLFDPPTLTLAVFAPGTAQFRGGRALAGAAFVAGLAASLATAVAARADERAIDRDVATAYSVYRDATSEAGAVQARTEVERLVGTARSARRRQNAAFGAAAVVYGASLVDAFVRHAFRPGLRAVVVRPQSGIEVGLHGAGARLGLAF